MRASWLACLLTLSACGPSAEQQQAAITASRERFVISQLGLSMAVPPPYAVYRQHAAEDAPWVVDLAVGARQARRITLQQVSASEHARPEDHDLACPWEGPWSREVHAGSTVRYFTAQGCGGSGGEEAWLAGLWTIDGRSFRIGCGVQQEPGFGLGPDPASCLVHLRGARAIPATDTPVRFGPNGSDRAPLERMLGEP